MALFRSDSGSSGSSSKVARVSPASQGRTSVPSASIRIEAPVDQPLPLLPIRLGQDPHAGIQEPDQRTTDPDQERRVEAAILSHLKLAVPVNDPGFRIPAGPEQPPQSQAQQKVGARRQRPHAASIPGEQAGDADHDQNRAHDVEAANLFAEEGDARQKDEHVSEAGQPVGP
jgi:hypothetical protein